MRRIIGSAKHMKHHDKKLVSIGTKSPESPPQIIEALRDSLALATDAPFEQVTIVLKMANKSHVIVRSGE